MKKHEPKTASKKRIARAYEKGRCDGGRLTADRARREAAARYERLLMPEVDRGRAVIWLGERPTQPVVRVMLHGGLDRFSAEEGRFLHPLSPFEAAVFQLEQQGQQIELPGPGGYVDPFDRRIVLVRWAGWKFLRLE